ncbi:MAG TPA: carbon storage regulator CsrA [Solirubrobacteraceae bacterium]|nr:carbon storage regulator CsrA [Solirubrobacteraceae bacterium]
MLVLTRRSNQSIMIGDDIEVSILAVVGDKVRIGIEAPGNIPVYRTEIYLEIQSQEAEGELEQSGKLGDEGVAEGATEVADELRRLSEER